MYKEYVNFNEQNLTDSVRDATEEEMLALIESKVDLTNVPGQMCPITFRPFKVYNNVKYFMEDIQNAYFSGVAEFKIKGELK